MSDTTLWEKIVQAGASPICAFDRDYRLTAFNKAHGDAFFRVYGHRAQVGDVLPDFFLPEQATVLRDFMARALGGETFSVVEAFGDPDLTKPHWDIRYCPLRDHAGEIVGAFHVAHDITDRLKVEAKLSEARLRFAAAAGRMGLWELDLETWELATSAICKINFGRDPDAPFTYQDLRDAVHPDDRERMRKAVETTIATGSDYDIEYRVCRPDGAVGWVQIRAQLTPLEDGRSARMAGVSVEITERKHAELRAEALARLGQQIRDIQDPDDLAFAAAELLGRTLDVSRVGYGLVDRSAETITIARDWNMPGVHSLAGTLQFRDYGSYIEDLLGGETVVVADARLDARTHGTAAALEAISAKALVNMPLTEQGGFVALLYLNQAKARVWSDEDLAFIREVAERIRSATERRRAEMALADLAASLETQVQQRTHELMAVEEALRQSQKMEAVGQLTGGLAHDFNNLLTGISGSLELLDARIAEGRFDAVGRYVAAAQGAARRAAALTHRLLAFSRRQTLDPKSTDVNRLVADMEDLVRRTVGPGVEIEVVQAAGLWPTLVDSNQLENALLNLCINARDAMPGGGRMTIETANKWLDERAGVERDLPPGQYVSLCVTDTGTGMTPDVVARAFDPFFTTKPIGEGTGLGLSMIYGFARQSGGQVRIYSEVGSGTTMCLYLPRDQAPLVAASPEVRAELVSESGSGEVVLVVDDEPTVRMLITEVLEGLGYGSIEAADGAAGLRVLEAGARIDLLITDVGLPGGMNGRQVADAARVRRPDLKVLFITGYAENAAIGNGHLEPGMMVMTKPFTMSALSSRVRQLLSDARA